MADESPGAVDAERRSFDCFVVDGLSMRDKMSCLATRALRSDANSVLLLYHNAQLVRKKAVGDFIIVIEENNPLMT